MRAARKKEWDRIVATPGTSTYASQRLPRSILARYRNGETVKELADDYGLPTEQIEWGIRIGYLLEEMASGRRTSANCSRQASWRFGTQAYWHPRPDA